MKEYRTQEMMSQEGMEKTLKKFAEYLTVTDGKETFNIKIPPKFVRCNYEENTMVYVYEMQPWMANPMGTIHGGIIATIMDTTMGSMTYYMAGESFTPTVTMKVDYVYYGTPDRPVYVGCKCTRCGKAMAYVTAKCWQDDEDKPIATADGVFYAAH